jgi:FkbM family methyltransferase
MLTSLKRTVNRVLHRLGYEFGRYPNPAVLGPHLKKLLDLYEINCVIDAGACIGQYGRLLRGVGYTGRIVSFEPVAESFAALQSTSRFDGAWLARNLALGAEERTLLINVTRHPGLCSFLEPAQFIADFVGREAEVKAREEAAMTRLDRIFDDLVAGLATPRVYLKMDTQGYDIEVLKGAAGCLDRIVALQTEVATKYQYHGMTGYQEVISYLEERGFQISGIFPVALDERDLTAIEFDCVMVRPAGLS